MRVGAPAYLLFASIALAGAAHAQTAAPVESTVCHVPGTNDAFPTSLAPGFTLTDTVNYEPRAPGGGCSVEYRAAGRLGADLYVYSANLTDIADQPRDPRVMEQFQRSIQEILQVQRKRGGTVSDLAARYETHGTAHRVEVQAASAAIALDSGARFRTHLFLWTGRGALWKLRVSCPTELAEVCAMRVQNLIDNAVNLSRGAR